MSPSTGAGADSARAEVRDLIAAKGHTVDNARAAIARLEAAFADGSLMRTAALEQFRADLMQALDQDEGAKLGGKSAEAARFILRAVDRELDQAQSGLSVAGDMPAAAGWKGEAAAALAGIADQDDRDVIEGDLATLPI